MTPVFEPLADDALLLRFGDTMDAGHNALALSIAAQLGQASPDWLCDVVPAYASLAVFFDTDRVDHADPHAFVATRLRAMIDEPAKSIAMPVVEVEVPVCYDAQFGPDLSDAAQELGLVVEELIHRHCAEIYTVAMIGFAPGFPYLLGLPESMALPRLATPRTRVPAGSVAIGGNQAGIYPRESPGGWRLLGRTPLLLFDPMRPSPSLLSPGDRVRFQRVDRATFDRLQTS
ncbi:MAG: 5-oxoprolinase subunit PxpB [Pseudoxanthomonas sp.]